MLRVTWVLLAEAFVFAALAALLLARPQSALVARAVAGVLGVLVLVLLVVALGQRRTLRPLASRVGLCEVCR